MKATLAKFAASVIGGLKSKEFQQVFSWIKEAARKQLSNPEKLDWVVQNLVNATFGTNQKWIAQTAVQLIFAWAKFSGLLDDNHKPIQLS